MAKTAAQKKTAREKARERARRKTAPPVNFWRAGEHDITLGTEEFRVRGWQGGKQKLLDDNVESVAWDFGREDRVSGTVVLRRPGSEHERLGVGVGGTIGLEYRRTGWRQWRRCWKMRVYRASRSPVDGGASYDVRDDLTYLALGTEEWKFKRNKSHKRGWLPIGIVEAVARRKGIRLGRVYRGRYRIRNIVREAVSALDVLRIAYRHEREKSGKRFIISMVDGPLEIRELVRSPSLYELGPLIIEAAVEESMRGNMATVITARATSGTKKKKKKIVVEVRSRTLARRYGRIHRTIHVDADSKAEARKEAKRVLTERGKPRRTVTFTHPGIPALRRGHALRLYFPHEGLKQIVFVKEVRHEASAGAYNMNVTVEFDDPYFAVAEERAKAKRCAAARKRGRKAPDDCPKAERKKPKSRSRR